MKRNLIYTLMLLIAAIAIAPAWARAQEEAAPAEGAKTGDQAAPSKTVSSDVEQLSGEEERVATRYRSLKEKLLRMADLLATTNPRQAGLLRRAVAKGDELDVDDQFSQLIATLKQDELSTGAKQQEELSQSLASILELLVIEDRQKQIESEKARIRAYLKEINLLAKEQRAIANDTQGPKDAKQIAEAQAKLGERTGELAQKIEKNEGKPAGNTPKKGATKETPSDKKDKKTPDDKKSPEDKKTPDKKTPDDKKSGDDKDDKKGSDKDASKPSGEQKPSGEKGEKKDTPQGEGDAKKNDPSGKPKEGEPGQPGDPNAPPSEETPEESPPDQNPTQRRVEQAQKRMREAQEHLEKTERDGAKEKQQAALEELAKAKAELEAILRQLREEEQGQTLKMLEARFAAMLKMQNEVLEGTVRLDKKPEAQRDHDDEIESGRLSRKEAEIVAEVDKAFVLLHEEPSTVAFPEAVSDLRELMRQVVVRLAQTKVDALTQDTETEIVQGLEEMITALKKVRKERDNKKNAQKQNSMQGGGQQGDPPLVDGLSELKMIRSLQVRVNQRTKRYADMLEKGQGDTPELVSALRDLAGREERIHRVTRDIVVGRNQ